MTRTTIEAVDLFAARFCHVTSDHARQRDDGKYFRTDKPITRDTVLAHLRGEITIAPYLMDARDTVRVGVLDHDDKRYIPNPDNPTVGRFVEEDGLALLQDACERLQRQGIDSALEESRRGGHLWVIAREPIPARDMRALLLLAAGRDERRALLHGERALELHPGANGRPAGGVGDNIRLPLGVQRKELGELGGGRHPFVDRNGVAVAPTIAGQLSYACDIDAVDVARHLGERAWLREALEMIECKPWQRRQIERAPVLEQGRADRQLERAFAPGGGPIREWVAQVDCRDVVQSYGIPLSGAGAGHCPWPEHHANGDRDASFSATERGWRCWAMGESGNAYDFVARMEGYDPKALRGQEAMEVLRLAVTRMQAALSVNLGRTMGPTR